MPFPTSAAVFRALLLAGVVAGAAACDSGEPDDTSTDTILGGVNFTRLLAEPTPAEVQAVEASWAARNPRSSTPQVVGTANYDGATLQVFSHTVTAAGCETVTHYAAVRTPAGLAPGAPLLVVHHGGDSGFAVNELAGYAQLMPELFSRTVQVMPVYRSEELRVGLGINFTASGRPSPWDCDVDDAIASVQAVLAAFPTAVSSTQRAALGISRGGATAVLHGVRDPEMDAVADYFGPTDFLNDTVQGLGVLAIGAITSPGADDGVLNLPGVRYLTETVLLPLRSASGSYDAGADYAGARDELIRRSPGLFADALPDTQVHHHRGDLVVPFEFSVAFDARAAAGGAGSRVELFLYGEETPESATYHSPVAMPESIARVQTFLRAQLGL